MSVDLHLHTFHSDGSWSPEQLVTRAIELKLKHIAVTDHDTVAGIAAAQACAGEHIEVIPGIEINTIYKTESGSLVDVHVLGYFIDAASSRLEQVIQKQQQARQRLVTDTMDKLNGLGVPLTMEHIQACAGRGSIGRPHLTRAIVNAGGADSIAQAFDRFMSRKSPDFIPRHSVSPEEAISAITAAGGIASIAHPGRGANIEAIILTLKEAGLQAVEAFHRSHNYSLMKRYLKFAKANGLLVTGGSDCHGPTDNYPASIGSLRVPLHVVQDLKSALLNNSQPSAVSLLEQTASTGTV